MSTKLQRAGRLIEAAARLAPALGFKVREVEKRCKLASVLKRGDVTIEIE